MTNISTRFIADCPLNVFVGWEAKKWPNFSGTLVHRWRFCLFCLQYRVMMCSCFLLCAQVSVCVCVSQHYSPLVYMCIVMLHRQWLWRLSYASWSNLLNQLLHFTSCIKSGRASWISDLFILFLISLSSFFLVCLVKSLGTGVNPSSRFRCKNADSRTDIRARRMDVPRALSMKSISILWAILELYM